MIQTQASTGLAPACRDGEYADLQHPRSPVTVAGRLGHSDPSVTLRVYSHALEERDRAAAEIMGRVLMPTPPAVTELETG